MARIAQAEGRSRAEVTRLLLLAGVRAYDAGEPLRFRAPVRAESRKRTSVSGLRLVGEEERAG